MTVKAIIEKMEKAIMYSDEMLDLFGEVVLDDEREYLESARERFTEVYNYCLSYPNDLTSCYDLYKWICSLYGNKEA